MNRQAEGSRRWRAGMLLGSVACLGSVLALVAGQGSAAASTEKPFSVVICATGQSCEPGTPAVVSPGATSSSPATLTATITNDTVKATIGSVNLTPPSGVSVVSAALGTMT